MPKDNRFYGAASDAINETIRTLIADPASYRAGEIAQMLTAALRKANLLDDDQEFKRGAVATRLRQLGLTMKETGRPKKDATTRALPEIEIKIEAQPRAARPEAAEPKLSFRKWLDQALIYYFEHSELYAEHDTPAKLRKYLLSFLPKHLKGESPKLTLKFLFELFEEKIWKGNQRILQNAVLGEMGPVKVHDILHHQEDLLFKPPLWLVQLKYDLLRGVVSAPRRPSTHGMRGINRFDITSALPRELPDSSPKEPLHLLADQDIADIDVAIISSPKLGLPYNPLIEDNLLRCGFAAARKQGAKALVIAGGLFHGDFGKTAGPASLFRHIMEADEIDIQCLAECYQEAASERLDSLLPIYETAAERLGKRLRGWWKVARRPEYRLNPETQEHEEVIGEKPEFDGPVFVILAHEDFVLACLMAYYHLNYQRIKDQAVAKAQLRVAAHELDEAQKAFAKAQWSGATAYAQSRLDTAQAAFDAAADNDSRTRNTNWSRKREQEVFDVALSYLIAEVERVIPNATVISQNRAYVRFGKSSKVCCFVSGEKGNPYYAELSSHGSTQRAGLLPDATIIMHSGAVYPRGTVRANYLGAVMSGECAFLEAPSLLDTDFIRDATRGIRSTYPAIRAACDSMYESGMAILRLREGLVPEPKILRASVVRAIAKGQQSRTPKTQPKMVWGVLDTDMHFGGAMRYRMLDHHGLPIGCTEAGLALLARSEENGLSEAAFFISCDDGVHGNHFGTHVQAHPNEMTSTALRALAEPSLDIIESTTDIEELRASAYMLIRHYAWQLDYRGSHNLTGQFTMLSETLMERYLSTFAAIVRRSRKSGVVVRGISHYTGQPFDSRDVGIINLPTGNHGAKTTNYMLLEGVQIAREMRYALRALPGMRNLDLKRLVQAPLLQRQLEGVGTIQIGRSAPWGLNLMDTPPSRDSWIDLLHAWVKVNKKRGNITTALDRMPVLHVTGDKHFYCWAHAGGDAYVMGSADTNTDGFANMAGGLPPNVFGFDFIGLPADGPDSGPIQTVHLSASELQPYIGHRDKKFPWGDVLVNRL